MFEAGTKHQERLQVRLSFLPQFALIFVRGGGGGGNAHCVYGSKVRNRQGNLSCWKLTHLWMGMYKSI